MPVLEVRFGTIELTVYNMLLLVSVNDCRQTSHRMQTTLKPAQEAVDLAPEFLNPKVACSGLDWCLLSRRVGNLHDLYVKAP